MKSARLAIEPVCKTIQYALAALLSIASTTAAHAEPPWHRSGRSPTSEPECKAASGEWSRTPFFNIPFCRIRFSDSGKECHSASDCQSLICIIGTPESRPGKCHGEAEAFGTFRYLDKNGNPQQILIE